MICQNLGDARERGEDGSLQTFWKSQMCFSVNLVGVYSLDYLYSLIYNLYLLKQTR